MQTLVPATGIRRDFDAQPPCFPSVEQAVATLAEDRPIHVLYPEILRRQARRFIEGFRGEVLFAVKANPAPAVLTALYEAGLRCFDVASVAEIETVRRLLPQARLSFMHPVKSRRAIRYAYLAGIRDFAFDSAAELDKICEETQAHDLTLVLRLGLPKGGAKLDLSAKFGVAGAEAAALLRSARARASRLAVSFHVGSQCHEPRAFADAVAGVREIVDAAAVEIDMIDVGGGFPVAYPGMTPPPLETFFAAVHAAVAENGFGDLPLLCEPGRAMVAEGGSVLARVELRKGDRLYLNDGTYGALFDAGTLGWRYPVRRVGAAETGAALTAFRFFGPTCDGMDAMEGPFHLPADMAEGDWIEIGHLGAYGAAMRTRFNGFDSELTVAVESTQGLDEPMTRQLVGAEEGANDD